MVMRGKSLLSLIGLSGAKSGSAAVDESLEDAIAEAKEALIKPSDSPRVTVVSPHGTLSAMIRGVEYNLRVTKPAVGAGVGELRRSLERNREMLQQSYDEMKDIFRLVCALPPELAILPTEPRFRTATKNALVARANIDVLIPLINMRGGEAAYQGMGEGLPIEQHVESLRRTAEAEIEDELGLFDEVEPDNEISMQAVGIAGFIVVLVVMLLMVFL